MFKVSAFSKSVGAALFLMVGIANAAVSESNIRYRGEMKDRSEAVATINKQKYDYRSALDYLFVRSWDELKSKRGAIPVSDESCNNTSLIVKYGACIPLSMYQVLRDTEACRLPSPEAPYASGPCYVSEKGKNGIADGYFLGSYIDGQGLTRVFRAEITKASTVAMAKRISEIENGQTVIFSQRAQAPVKTVAKNVEAEEAAVEEQRSDLDTTAQKETARARVKQALHSGNSIDRVDLWNAITIETEGELYEGEKAVESVRRKMKQSDLRAIEGGGYATCYIGGKVKAPWVFILRADGMLDRVSTESKANIYCYKDGQLKIKMGVLIKLKENAIGLRFPGTKSLLGGFGLGVLESVIDIATTRQADGSLRASRKQVCIAGADAGWIFGVGTSQLCLSEGKLQNPILGGGFRLSLTAGATVSPLSIYEIGLDPDQF